MCDRDKWFRRVARLARQASRNADLAAMLDIVASEAARAAGWHAARSAHYQADGEALAASQQCADAWRAAEDAINRASAMVDGAENGWVEIEDCQPAARVVASAIIDRLASALDN